MRCPVNQSLSKYSRLKSAASILHGPIHLQTESCILWLLCLFYKLSFSLFVPNSLIWPFSLWLTKLDCYSTEESSHWTDAKLWRKICNKDLCSSSSKHTNLFQLLIHFRDIWSAYFRVFVHYYCVSFPFLKCFPPRFHIFFRPQTLSKKTPTGNKWSNSTSGKNQAIEMKRCAIHLSMKFAQFYL